MSRRVILSEEGLKKLREELQLLKTAKRKEVAKALQVARAHGDLRENAEYDAAKEEQAFVESRIAELEYKIANARIIDESKMAVDQVFIGATVTLYDIEFDEEIQHTLVSEDEVDLNQNKISVHSAVAKALLGKKVDDEIDIEVPAGILRYKILKIERL